MFKYYQALYTPDSIDKQMARSFLENVDIPKVTPSQLEALNAPISLPEISSTIRNLTPSKAKYPDGFTSEFYKTLQTTTEPALHKVYNGIRSGGPYLPTGNQAIIKLLSKKGKDPKTQAPIDPSIY